MEPTLLVSCVRHQPAPDLWAQHARPHRTRGLPASLTCHLSLGLRWAPSASLQTVPGPAKSCWQEGGHGALSPSQQVRAGQPRPSLTFTLGSPCTITVAHPACQPRVAGSPGTAHPTRAPKSKACCRCWDPTDAEPLSAPPSPARKVPPHPPPGLPLAPMLMWPGSKLPRVGPGQA